MQSTGMSIGEVNDDYVIWRTENKSFSIYKDGMIEYRYKGKIHRDDDLPAVIFADGEKWWFTCGINTRKDRPYRTNPFGRQEWDECNNRIGKLIFISEWDQRHIYRRRPYKDEVIPGCKPTIPKDKLIELVYPNGTIVSVINWKKKGYAIFPDGTVMYYQDDKLRSINDNPAVDRSDGTQLWMRNEVLHRMDGPAAILPDGKLAYCINGKMIIPECKKLL